MYPRHFGLQQDPFSIAPDPRFLFMSERHREALAHLLYGLQGGGGFVLLTGAIGAGKTTVCRAFLEQVGPEQRLAYIFNPPLSADELMLAVCEEFGIELPGSGRKVAIDALNRFLLAAHAKGQNCVLVIDEAQGLPPKVLEQLRLLTNLETAERKLLQIILIGQPELRKLLARPELEQVAQRVIARYHLGPLDEADTAHYVKHRLAVAAQGGKTAVQPFARRALQRLHELSGGVPRRINLLAGRAMLGAYSAGLDRVDARLVEQAAREMFDAERPPSFKRWVVATGAVAVIASALAMAWLVLRPSAPAKPQAAAASAPALPASASAAEAIPVAASTPAVAAAPAVFQWPEQPPDDGLAWQGLAKRFGIAWTSADPCAEAATHGLQCFRARNLTLAEIAAIDRPGVITLQSPDGARHAVLLLGLDAEHATLAKGEGRERMPRSLLGVAWRGDFATLWRLPPEGAAPSSAWLQSQLERLPGAATAGTSLRDRITAFQRAQGLAADGVAGERTLMQLNRALGMAEPALER